MPAERSTHRRPTGMTPNLHDRGRVGRRYHGQHGAADGRKRALPQKGPDMTSPEEAQALRKYRMIAEIGKGGMADVFLAVVQGPASFNKLVVIKKTRTEFAHEAEFLAMFL